MKVPLSYSNETTNKFDKFSLWLRNPIVPLQLQLLVFCTLSGFLHFILKRLGVPRFSCQLITGIIFGCSWKHWEALKFQVFTIDSEDALGLYSSFGYTLFLFITAVKVNPKMIIQTEKKALIIGVSTLMSPMITGLLIQAIFSPNLTKKQTNTLPIIHSYHSMVTFPVISSLLYELDLVNSKLGRLGLSSALVCDLLSIFLVSLTNLVKGFKESPSKASITLAGLALFLSVIFFVFRPLIIWLVKKTPDEKPVPQSSVQTVIFLAFSCLVLFKLIGRPLTGAYILGFACPYGDPLASTLVNRVEGLVLDVFMPVMVSSYSLRADVSQLLGGFGIDDGQFSRLNLILVWVASVVKLGSCLLACLFCKLSVKEGLVLSIILSCKGVVELFLYAGALDKHNISEKLFSSLILIVLLFATFVPIIVKHLYDPSTKYSGCLNPNIMHLNPNSELRVLTCFHKDQDIFTTIHLLNISSPSKANPISIFGFHLIEIVGRMTPTITSHSSQENCTFTGEKPHSATMLSTFKAFEQDNNGAVSVECYTAISPNKVLHNDICLLALEKLTSLLILPFHRTWLNDGFEDDNAIRSLNCSVLEKAPCSVGIFAGRGRLVQMGLDSKCRLYSVCLIFLGGNDDREAISYAKRLVNDKRVELTVLRLKFDGEDENSGEWEEILNCEVVRSLKMKCGDGSVKYKEEVSNSGAETIERIKETMSDCDLVIVGRRYGVESPQTSGLSEWIEFPELGIVGDLIVSTDINVRASVLVIHTRENI